MNFFVCWPTMCVLFYSMLPPFPSDLSPGFKYKEIGIWLRLTRQVLWYCDKISGESNFNIEIFLSSSTLLILCLRWGEHHGSINMWHRFLTSQQTRSGQNSKEERPGQVIANKAEVIVLLSQTVNRSPTCQ